MGNFFIYSAKPEDTKKEYTCGKLAMRQPFCKCKRGMARERTPSIYAGELHDHHHKDDKLYHRHVKRWQTFSLAESTADGKPTFTADGELEGRPSNSRTIQIGNRVIARRPPIAIRREI